MAVIKVFDAKGIKTLVLSGNAQEQPYDAVECPESAADQDTEAAEEDL